MNYSQPILIGQEVREIDVTVPIVVHMPRVGYGESIWIDDRVDGDDYLGEHKELSVAFHLARKLDWEAVWRNWIRRCVDQRPRGASASRTTDPDTPTETFAQRAARQRMAEVAPGVARKAPGADSGFAAAQRFMAGGPVIDVSARDAAPRIEGAAA